MWVGMYREDRLQPTFKRIRRTVTLGPCNTRSRRAALAALQPYLDAVNVAPTSVLRNNPVRVQSLTDPRDKPSA
jgi:hypothetical protein